MSAISKKRKHISLSIADKISLVKAHEQGTTVNSLCETFSVGKSTVYDILKQREKLLQFFSESDSPAAMKKRKTLRTANNADLDKVLIEWIRQKRTENVPLTGPLIVEQAKVFHEKMGVSTLCNYSTGWLQKFKNRHGIRYLRICGEKASADEEASELFIEEITKMVSDEKISSELIYNADETSLFWRYVPRKTLATADETNPTGIKDMKDRLTVLACTNAAGTHKLKLLIIGKSANPRSLKGVPVPVVYRANKRAWMTKDLFQEWFNMYFVPEAQAHCKSKGFPSDSKILLILDNCSAHPNPTILNTENIKVIFLPPNCTSLIQPMDMGLLRAFKCRYKNYFLRQMLEYVNDNQSVLDFVKYFNVKKAIFSASHAWDAIDSEMIKNAWRHLLPTIKFIDEIDDDDIEFEGFKVQNKDEISELLDYAKNGHIILDKSDIDEIMCIDENVPIVGSRSESEIIDSVVNKEKADVVSENESENEETEKISTEELIKSLDKTILGLEQRNFVSENELMTIHRIREKVIANKPKLKQKTLIEMFKK